jgi:hypothetical protein
MAALDIDLEISSVEEKIMFHATGMRQDDDEEYPHLISF